MTSDASLKIVEDYAHRLNKLTFNSRPIITELTEIAGEHTDVADGIVDAITNRIYKCIPEQKLFVLYLLDSVCKNVGSPYNIVFGDDMFKLFSYVYSLVGDAVRQKMVNLFETWKLTKTKGMNIPLFPDEQMEKIENLLVQARLKGLTNRSLIDDINKIIPVFEMKLNNNPDQRLKEKLNALMQLRTLLSGQQMKPNELLAVQTRLNDFKQQELTSSGVVATPRSITPASTAASTAVSTPKLPPTPISVPRAKELFQALIASGLVTIDQSLIPGANPKYELVFPRIKYQTTNNELPSSNVLQDILSTSASNNIKRTEYGKVKFNELSKIENDVTKSLQSFINSNTPSSSSISLLYSSKPSKCGLCGKRFTNDDNGATKNRLHLDWHFRINKKLTSGNSNVQARNWYLDDIDWAKFKDEDLLEYSTTLITSNPVVSSSVPANNEISYVIVPSSETNMNNKCIICREQIKATYNDDLGEWCWMNCVKAPGEGKNSRKIVHITCFDEANRKRGPDGDLNTNVKREKF